MAGSDVTETGSMERLWDARAALVPSCGCWPPTMLACGNLCCASCCLMLCPFASAPHRHTLCGSAPSNSDSDSDSDLPQPGLSPTRPACNRQP
eukprot:352443-Chlamydomonas_euryale.AAC.9